MQKCRSILVWSELLLGGQRQACLYALPLGVLEKLLLWTLPPIFPHLLLLP